MGVGEKRLGTTQFLAPLPPSPLPAGTAAHPDAPGPLSFSLSTVLGLDTPSRTHTAPSRARGMTQRASPRGHPTAPSGDCAAGTFAPALARALSLALLVLFAYAAFRDTSADSATGRRAPVYLTSPGSVGGRRAGLRTFAEPWFCHGSPCAPFAADAARSGAGYEARAYEPGTRSEGTGLEGPRERDKTRGASARKNAAGAARRCSLDLPHCSL